ncbi:EthD family reductase [Mesorhizobium sp. M2E.F.Ca.ET.209.01.1.1]|uniref:EthD family reductase n=1 Tax=Mesorhizobium sp. M2E.F.Ca.ET.209.01.1.1 TaxID=2500526 RepID=UPI000FDA4186|nr:EthD family reductase [Mesorhizobium sp. M2E.F.Ca.ET.209.01.1.1]TGS16176.1 EthD family reductase [Mesorhizobium sp. M2E.F.Ca.ET.209.01.1.1]
MAGMVVIYKQPADAQAFDKHYFETHIPLAKKIPGLRKYEVSRGPITVLAGPSDVYLIGILHFDDLDAMKEGFASPEGKAAGADRRLYAPDESGVQMLIFDSREV